MNLEDLLGPRNIIPEMAASNRWQAIDELIDRLIAEDILSAANRDAVLEVVRKRETSMSTGIGFGIGLPHASTDCIDDVVAAFGRSKQGINFDALDNQPVKLVLLLLVPQGQFQKHLHTLASIAKVLHNKSFRKAIEDASDAEAILEIIRSQPSK